MSKLYWVATCHHCGQGRLFIFWNEIRNIPYLHCEECEWGWYDPEKLDTAEGFLTLNEEFEARAATANDIREAGWEEYIVGSESQ